MVISVENLCGNLARANVRAWNLCGNLADADGCAYADADGCVYSRTNHGRVRDRAVMVIYVVILCGNMCGHGVSLQVVSLIERAVGDAKDTIYSYVW